MDIQNNVGLTNIDQSCKLIRLGLDPDTADFYIDNNTAHTAIMPCKWDYESMKKHNLNNNLIPCWSIAALMSILPKGTRVLKSTEDEAYHCDCPLGAASYEFYHTMIEAIYHMVVWIHEKREAETIQLHSLLKTVEFESVFSKICKWFPDQKRNKFGYKKVFNELCLKIPNESSDFFIDVHIVEEDNERWLNVNGISLDDGKHYSITFHNWTDWVSMFITEETFKHLSSEDIVAGCLYEMTFFGFTEKN